MFQSSRAPSSALAALLALALAACALSACRPGGNGAPQTVLKVASQRGGTRALMEASGALEGAPYRVEWSEFPSAQTLLEALKAGAVDAGAVGDAPFLFAAANGSGFKAVQALRTEGSGLSVAILVPPGSPVRTVADLRGRRIATGRGSIGHYLALLALERAGVAPGAVRFIFLSPGDAKAALAAGSVDAWATWGSYIHLATLRDGDRVVVDNRGLLHGVNFEAATDGAIRDKRAALNDFLTRLATAEAWASGHPDAYAAVLAKDTGLPEDVARLTVGGLSVRPVPIDTALISEEAGVLKRFKAAGAVDAVPDVSRAFDGSVYSPK